MSTVESQVISGGAPTLLVAAETQLLPQLCERVGDGPGVKRVVLEVLVREFLEHSQYVAHPSWRVIDAHLSRKTHEEAVVIHHVRALFVVVRLAIWICRTGRKEGRTIERTVTVQAVDDLVAGGSPKRLFIGFSDCFQRTVPADTVPFRTDSIVWTFMVVRVESHVVQLVDDVRVNQLRVTGIDALRATALRDGAVSSPLRLYRMVLGATGPPPGEGGTGRDGV